MAHRISQNSSTSTPPLFTTQQEDSKGAEPVVRPRVQQLSTSSDIRRFFSPFSQQRTEIPPPHDNRPITARVSTISEETIGNVQSTITAMEERQKRNKPLAKTKGLEEIKNLFDATRLKPVGVQDGVIYFKAKKNEVKSNFIVNPLNNALVYWDIPRIPRTAVGEASGSFKVYITVPHYGKKVPITKLLSCTPTRSSTEIQKISNAIIEKTIDGVEGAKLLVPPQPLWSSSNTFIRYTQNSLALQFAQLWSTSNNSIHYTYTVLGDEALDKKVKQQNMYGTNTILHAKHRLRDMMLAEKVLNSLGHRNFDAKIENVVLHNGRSYTIDIDSVDTASHPGSVVHSNVYLYKDLKKAVLEHYPNIDYLGIKKTLYPLFSAFNMYEQLLKLLPKKPEVLYCCPYLSQDINPALFFVIAPSLLPFLQDLEEKHNQKKDFIEQRIISDIRKKYLKERKEIFQKTKKFSRLDALLLRSKFMHELPKKSINEIQISLPEFIESAKFKETSTEYSTLTLEEIEELNSPKFNNPNSFVPLYYQKTLQNKENVNRLVQDSIDCLDIQPDVATNNTILIITQLLMYPNKFTQLIDSNSTMERTIQKISTQINDFLATYVCLEEARPAEMNPIYSYIPVEKSTESIP